MNTNQYTLVVLNMVLDIDYVSVAIDPVSGPSTCWAQKYSPGSLPLAPSALQHDPSTQ